MTRKIRFGVSLPQWDFHVYTDAEVSFQHMLAMAQEAERLGYDFATLDDHLQRGSGGRMFENLTTLSALAAQTTRIRLRTMVLSNMYRPPSLLAKMAATIDNISNGRLDLGLGAGWKEEEALSYGLPWDTPKARADRLEEACQVILALWTNDIAHFAGKYYRLEGAICNPRPVQKPHPPLWIAGAGKKRTPHITALYADGAGFGPRGTMEAVEHFTHKREVLYSHCREVGRDPSEISLTCGVEIMLWGRSQESLETRFGLVPKHDLSQAELLRLPDLRKAIRTPEEAATLVQRYVSAGATDVVVLRATMEGIQRFAQEVMPQFK